MVDESIHTYKFKGFNIVFYTNICYLMQYFTRLSYKKGIWEI